MNSINYKCIFKFIYMKFIVNFVRYKTLVFCIIICNFIIVYYDDVNKYLYIYTDVG